MYTPLTVLLRVTVLHGVVPNVKVQSHGLYEKKVTKTIICYFLTSPDRFIRKTKTIEERLQTIEQVSLSAERTAELITW